MNVLVACEFSGIVRNEFEKLGHNAWSCDLLPSELPGNHYQGDVFEFLNKMPTWDLIIAHPPCTDLAVSGARYFKQKRANGTQQIAIDFFMRLASLDCTKICIENPIGIMSRIWRKPDQIIQPWEFGHPESKATCLWLKGLPKLQSTNILQIPERGYWNNQTPSGQNKLVKISNTQRYKTLGNSFTVEIIAHILSFIGKGI
jgi:site-specific DNA-cytosine methylase